MIDSSYCFFNTSFSLYPPSHSQQKFPKTCRPVSFLLHVLPFPPFLFSPPFSPAACLFLPADFLPYYTFSLQPLRKTFYLVLAALSLLSYPFSLILSVLSLNSCPFCLILPSISLLSFPSCPLLHFCLFLSALSFLPYHSCPIFPVLYFLHYPPCLITPLLSFLPHPSYLNLTTLSCLPDTVVSIQSSLPYTCCHITLSKVSIPYLLSI